MGEHLQSSAHVRNVYGEPVTAGNRTVIPVARLGYGLGAGSGGIDEKGGGGGGGGVGALPVGVVEITPEGTKFIRFGGAKRLAGAIAAGFLLGFVMGRLKS
jgi:uncharacterized spore protein YtfJ